MADTTTLLIDKSNENEGPKLVALVADLLSECHHCRVTLVTQTDMGSGLGRARIAGRTLVLEFDEGADRRSVAEQLGVLALAQ